MNFESYEFALTAIFMASIRLAVKNDSCTERLPNSGQLQSSQRVIDSQWDSLGKLRSDLAQQEED